ncbi:MAG: tetratricopeptide repeat protein [Candidatus Krumholzibacteriota bacterium]|nr:tetratricopeptide repeat protein [Candidatus Krumholzibacteriota bacterium]
MALSRYPSASRLFAVLFAAAVSAVCLILAPGVSVSGQDDFDEQSNASISDQRAVLDSLFSAGNFDSVLSLVPLVLDQAQAEDDSMAIGRLILIRGRAELSARKYVDGMASLDLAIRISEACADTLNWAEALGFKAFAVTWQGRYDECVELSLKKLSLSRLTGNRPGEAWARTALGYVYLQQGKLDQAREEYTLATEIFTAEGMKQAGLTPMIGLGRVYNTMQNEESARDCYQKVLVAARELGDLVQESHAVNNLGTLEYVYGDMSLAVQYYQRATELSEAMGNARGMITPASNTALAMTYLGNYEDAADILSSAITTCEELNYLDLLGTVRNRLGEVRVLQKRMNAAARLYRQVLGMGSMLNNKQRFEAVTGLADALNRMDSTAAAIEVLEVGLASPYVEEYETKMNIMLAGYIRREGRPGEALARLEKMERQIGQAADIQQKLEAAFELSASLRAAGRPAEAYEWFHRALDLIDERREMTGSHEWREVQTGNWSTVSCAGIVLEYPPDRLEAERVEEMFNIFQRYKARTLTERLTEPRRQDGPQSDLSKISPISLSELRHEVLGPGELFLDFVVGDRESYLFAVTAKAVRMAVLPGRKSDFAARVGLYREAVSKRPQSGDRGEAEIDLAGMNRQFGDLILGQVGDLVRGARRLLIAPDNYFSSVPFGALIISDPGDPESEERQLCESKENQQIPSATMLKWLRVRSGTGKKIDTPARILAVAPGGGARLKGAEEEVDFLRGRIAGVDIFDGGEKEFFDMDNSTEVIHIATHVKIDDEKIWHSGFLLGPENDNETSTLEFEPDTYLRAGDIAGGSIPARLVVLSGCESARGKIAVGEGMFGLPAAFISSGASAVVATLWPVDDAATADLMREFYKELAKGKTVAAALQRSQMTVRGRKKTEPPFYWAGFVVIGNGNITVDLEEKGVIRYLQYIVLLMVLVAGFAIAIAAAKRKNIMKSNGKM